MADLISVDDCPCDGCKAKPCGHPARCVKFTLWLNKAVDAVEVVRCKDCVFENLSTCPMCYIEQQTLQFLNHDPDFYCAAGDRRCDV